MEKRFKGGRVHLKASDLMMVSSDCYICIEEGYSPNFRKLNKSHIKEVDGVRLIVTPQDEAAEMGWGTTKGVKYVISCHITGAFLMVYDGKLKDLPFAFRNKLNEQKCRDYHRRISHIITDRNIWSPAYKLESEAIGEIYEKHIFEMPKIVPLCNREK